MASSHVLKFTPKNGSKTWEKKLPSSSLLYKYRSKSPVFGKDYSIDTNTNLPNRCEALAHSVIDNLKMQTKESKGSPISPTSNHVAVLMFMLSHYIADAHVPMHCDSRKFSNGVNVHGLIESEWDDEIKKYYEIDSKNDRFYYNREGYPLQIEKSSFENSYINSTLNKLSQRDFTIGWGSKNDNVLEYMSAICHYSYALSYYYIPKQYNASNVTSSNWQSLSGQEIDFNTLSQIVLADAIDSIAKVWFRVWRRYIDWKS